MVSDKCLSLKSLTSMFNGHDFKANTLNTFNVSIRQNRKVRPVSPDVFLKTVSAETKTTSPDCMFYL